MTRSGLIDLLLFLLIVTVAWFGVWSLWQKSGDLRVSINGLSQSLEEERAAVRRLGELEQLTAVRAAEITKLETAVPPRRDAASLIAAFEEAASTNGLALDALDIFESEEQGGRIPSDAPAGSVEEGVGPAVFKTLNARIELTGRYLAFQSFLDALEKSFPLVDPINITFQLPLSSDIPEGTAALNPIFNFIVTLEGYYLAD